jgi:hypothetical protein
MATDPALKFTNEPLTVAGGGPALAPIVKGASAEKSHSDFQHPSVAEELAFLRKNFRDLMATYAGQIEGEITTLLGLVQSDAQRGKKLPAARAHELRDMLSLLRNLEIKPAKGRRRDLKKVENLLEELRRIVERWG